MPPPGAPAPEEPWSWRRRRLLVSLGVLLLIVPVLAGVFIQVPYYLISPGEARGVAELIKVKGDGAKTFPPKGKILFTTVSLGSEVSVFEALAGWLDDEVEVVPEERITGGAPRKEVRQQNIQAMVDSKLTATKVALERLGYRVSVNGDGALVMDVKPGDPADGHLQVGDVIKTVDGEAVTLHDQVVSKVRQHKPGDAIAIGFNRGGADKTVELKSIADPEGNARIGVVLQTHNLRYDFPVEVDIETGLVGGPSAGLAFTLALIDDLTEGELTGGRNVAVTGTIDAAGNIGQVGGVTQKTVTARDAGAIAFLVPPEEEKDARKFAGKMEIIPVRTLADALAALHRLGGSEVALPDGATAPPS
ncbi:MAG TPA: PDZ domain-containing protein [Acidimicrobiia bacterium]|nr:PDZ domain-containing protein [Acidimicrobiia bacterium]